MSSYCEELKVEFKKVHGAVAEFLYALPVRPPFNQRQRWNGAVWLFKVIGHPEARYGYAWLHPNASGDNLEFTTVLERFPVGSVLAAVRSLIGSAEPAR